jgi:hypothetical protein
VNWKETCRCGDIRYWRAADRRNADAADMIVSDVMDKYFDGPVNFEQIVKKFRYPFLNEQIGDVDSDLPKKKLFEVVCKDPSGGSGMWSGPGWKVTSLLGDWPLVKALADCGFRSEDQASRQALTGCQWGRVLGVPGVELDLETRGQQVAIRFRLGKPRVKGTKYNAEILGAPSESHQSHQLPSESHQSPIIT